MTIMITQIVVLLVCSISSCPWHNKGKIKGNSCQYYLQQVTSTPTEEQRYLQYRTQVASTGKRNKKVVSNIRHVLNKESRLEIPDVELQFPASFIAGLTCIGLLRVKAQQHLEGHK